MKKIYLSLLGAMMALTVGAQPQRGAIVSGTGAWV